MRTFAPEVTSDKNHLNDRTMKRTIITYLFAILGISTLWANDGVFYARGNFLVPLQETDISVAKEVLTITIGKDSMARVDVYYEFMNNGNPKTVTMAFEADPPYNVGLPLNHEGIHPFIKDFTVVMNSQRLQNKNAVIASLRHNGKTTFDFTPLDLTKWKGYGEAPDSLVPYENSLYNAELDSVVDHAYAYYFEAPFKKGRNIVHHTYSYTMSDSHRYRYEIPYWLTPATRWANRQVDDFTLKITADGHDEFCLYDSLFVSSPFTKTSQQGYLYNLTDSVGESMIVADVCPGDTVIWHGKNFRPTDGMYITPPDWDKSNLYYVHRDSEKVVIDKQGNVSRYLADCGDSYLVLTQDYGLVKKSESHIEEYSARKGNGIAMVSDMVDNRVNVRMCPNEKSKKIGTISATRPGECPKVFKCMGFVQDPTEEWGGYWWKIKFGNRVGYVAQQFMLWDSIDTY